MLTIHCPKRKHHLFDSLILFMFLFSTEITRFRWNSQFWRISRTSTYRAEHVDSLNEGISTFEIKISLRNDWIEWFFSMLWQEYYQSDRPTPAHYRHSQSDLTEWDEPNHSTPQQRCSGGQTERDAHYPYRNGSREKEEWDENERPRPRYVKKDSFAKTLLWKFKI